MKQAETIFPDSQVSLLNTGMNVIVLWSDIPESQMRLFGKMYAQLMQTGFLPNNDAFMRQLSDEKKQLSFFCEW